MNLHRKTYKSRKKWEFMGICGQSFCMRVNKFKIFFKNAQYVVFKIIYFHTYGYFLGKSVHQKNNEFFTEKY